ncbi:ComF family protein [Vagococcus fluvialis]|uniref:ComF family protein n=1 Tax=Vagococcus fluvialis TaxID=2738 RepID=UPI003B5BD5D7
MKCSFCGDSLVKELKISDLLFFKPILFNECCYSCYETIKSQKNGKTCQFCQKKLTGSHDTCKDCSHWQKIIPHFSLHHTFLYDYTDMMSDYFKEFKFLGDIRKGTAFSKDVFKELSPFVKKGFIIVPIPLSKQGMKDRGFNQVEEMLKASSVPFELYLSKKNTISKQSERGKEERLLMKQPFIVTKNKRKRVENSKILLVDDVYTTGRTILHAYDCLSQYNPKEIRSFTLSR